MRFSPLFLLLVPLLSGCPSKSGSSDREIKKEELAASANKDAPLPPPQSAPKVKNASKWNYPAVTWTEPEEALSRMKSHKRPGLVVVKGEWCPHCRKYAEVFSDPEVAKLTESFELILLDNDSEAAEKWPSGTYVPRTLFLDPQGGIDSSFEGPNPRYPHFFSKNDKARFVEAMRKAAQKYGS